MAALEKLDSKPFRLMGFGKDGVATVTNWQNGALGQLPGDCAMRVSFRLDPKTQRRRATPFPATRNLYRAMLSFEPSNRPFRRSSSAISRPRNRTNGRCVGAGRTSAIRKQVAFAAGAGIHCAVDLS
jgi:hypothetical protein